MNRCFMALLIFLIAVILVFITMLIAFQPLTYLTEEQVASELHLEL